MANLVNPIWQRTVNNFCVNKIEDVLGVDVDGATMYHNGIAISFHYQDQAYQYRLTNKQINEFENRTTGLIVSVNEFIEAVEGGKIVTTGNVKPLETKLTKKQKEVQARWLKSTW